MTKWPKKKRREDRDHRPQRCAGSSNQDVREAIDAEYDKLEAETDIPQVVYEMAAEDERVSNTEDERRSDAGTYDGTQIPHSDIPAMVAPTELQYGRNAYYLRLIRSQYRISKALMRASIWAAKGRMKEVAEILAVILLSDDRVSKHTEERRVSQYRHLFRKRSSGEFFGDHRPKNPKKPKA